MWDGSVQGRKIKCLNGSCFMDSQVAKLMRQLIKYWRAKAIRVVIYIDDGIGGTGTSENAVIISQQVKSDLVGCGFTLNKKSVWTPTQQLP